MTKKDNSMLRLRDHKPLKLDHKGQAIRSLKVDHRFKVDHKFKVDLNHFKGLPQKYVLKYPRCLNNKE